MSTALAPAVTDVNDRRCRRGARCAHADRYTITTGGAAACPCRCHAGGGIGAVCDLPTGCADTHTDTTEQERRRGALLEHADGLCPGDTSRLVVALANLPDEYARLHLLHLPSMAIEYRTDDITGGEALSAPIPMSEYVDGLARKLVYELRTWQEIVADIAGVPWDSQEADACRPGFQLQQACQLLGYRIEQWLTAGVHEYRARSVTDDPTHGHNPETTTRYGDDWWCHRDGLDAACDVLSLYGQVLHLTSGAASASRSDHIPGVPCSYCLSTTGLRRDHFSGVVRCRHCDNERTMAGHNEFVAAALKAHAEESTTAAELVAA